ncbi:Vitamin K-dependent gamma-carboxylase [Araneus ventricosus]|uniref:Vitamin K-dependent gamma-carboxylase n=1 Tax=Araneus ventricosus TaxID=182803 RepID=A0A4Y2ILZ6_ARAVE|nr:Vitamin K-dependent gamma-carboxylase [Araneus ventricosus]
MATEKAGDCSSGNETKEFRKNVLENCIQLRNRILKELGIQIEDLSSFESFTRLLHKPRDPSSIAVIRILYGFLMIIDVHHERGLSSADSRWGNPFECRFPFFNFLKPLPLEWMIMIYLLMLLGAGGILLGYKYRLSCLCFLVPYWYIFFLDKSHWNNHSYLFGLIGSQLMLSGANRCWSLDGKKNPNIRHKQVPLWNYALLRGQSLSNEPLKILQINLSRAKAATNKLHLTASTIKPDVILVQEQYINNNGIPGIPQTWKTFSSSNQKATILIPSSKLKPALLATKVSMVALKIRTSSFPITIISAYSSPAQNVHTTLQEIQEIISSLPEEKIIIGADLRGHNTLWGYRSNDNRGKDILDFILANNLNIINKPGALPTFQKNNSVGWPDLTLYSQSLIDSSINWEVLEEISLSDHRYIETTIASTVANQFYKRYKTHHGNHLRFLNILGKEIYHLERKIIAARNSGELNNATIELQTLIINACNKSFKIKKQTPHNKTKLVDRAARNS